MGEVKYIIPTNDTLEAIGAVGRKATISKHVATNHQHLRRIISELDAAGMREAADTIIWQVWWRVLDQNRHEFLSRHKGQGA